MTFAVCTSAIRFPLKGISSAGAASVGARTVLGVAVGGGVAAAVGAAAGGWVVAAAAGSSAVAESVVGRSWHAIISSAESAATASHVRRLERIRSMDSVLLILEAGGV
jgi:hypothetical protein